MNKEEFLRQLEMQLSGMPENEKQEALQYYRDYFEDAGTDKEGEVLASLGSPADVAKTIREENGGGEYTEKGYLPTAGTSHTSFDSDADMRHQDNAYGQGNQAYGAAPQKEKKDTAVIVLSIILIILTSPLWIPLLGSLIGLICALVGGFIGFAVAGVVMVIACIVAVIASLVGMCVGLPGTVGLIFIGAALIIGAVGILFILLTTLICRYAIPWLCNCVKKLWNLIFGRKEAAR